MRTFSAVYRHRLVIAFVLSVGQTMSCMSSIGTSIGVIILYYDLSLFLLGLFTFTPPNVVVLFVPL